MWALLLERLFHFSFPEINRARFGTTYDTILELETKKCPKKKMFCRNTPKMHFLRWILHLIYWPVK